MTDITASTLNRFFADTVAFTLALFAAYRLLTWMLGRDEEEEGRER